MGNLPASAKVPFGSAWDPIVLVPELVIGVGLPTGDWVWHNCAHVK